MDEAVCGMKILDISSFYSEMGGGVKTYHTAKLRYFAEHPEHSYVLLVASDKNAASDVEGGRIYRVKGFPVGWKGAYRQMYDLPGIRRIIDRERPDIIEAGSPYLDCLLAALSKGRSGAKTVGFYHADVPDSYIAPAVAHLPAWLGKPIVGFMRFFVKFMYGRLDATVVTTRYIERKLGSLGLKRTHLVPLGVDTELFTPARRSEAVRRSLGVSPSEKLLLYVGRFRKEKGIDILAGALRELDRRPGVRIVLVGDGPHDVLLRDALKGCTKTIWMGYEADSERLADLYASADIFLSPGPYETFGLAALEAMSAGVPVVGADRGGTAELVAASGAGALFRAHDAEDLIHRVDTLLEADLDVHRSRARLFASGFSWTHTFDRMIDVYAKLIADRAERAPEGKPSTEVAESSQDGIWAA